MGGKNRSWMKEGGNECRGRREGRKEERAREGIITSNNSVMTTYR